MTGKQRENQLKRDPDGKVSGLLKISKSRVQTVEKLASRRSRTDSIDGQVPPKTVFIEATG